MSTRRAHDAYPTPAWCVDALLSELHLPGGSWLEPAAGEGAIIDAVRARRIDVSWRVVELREETKTALLRATSELTDEVVLGDYLKLPRAPYLHDVAILNPPFYAAEEFVAKARLEARVVVALLRLGFLASQRRASWLRQDPPDVFVLPRRPSFTGNGTDNSDFAWMVWGLPFGGGRMRVLDPKHGAPAKKPRAQLRLVETSATVTSMETARASATSSDEVTR